MGSRPLTTTLAQVLVDLTETITMQNGSGEAKDPSSFLGEIIGGKVTVKLNSGIVYKGEHQ